MKHVFLVTTKNKFINPGDSLYVEGVFKTKKSAKKYVDSTIDDEILEPTITKMEIGDANLVMYPSAYYYEIKENNEHEN